MSKQISLEYMIELAKPHLRQIVWHSDGRVAAKTGANAPHPKKLYGGLNAHIALGKLINDNVDIGVRN